MVNFVRDGPSLQGVEPSENTRVLSKFRVASKLPDDFEITQL
jgi:hypothetical protein